MEAIYGGLEAAVVPLLGTWIEIRNWRVRDNNAIPSFPYWERGLKYDLNIQYKQSGQVVPLLGTWIEILSTMMR